MTFNKLDICLLLMVWRYVGCICIANWEPLRHVPIWCAFCILGHARVTCILLFMTRTKVTHFIYQATCDIMYAGLATISDFCRWFTWIKKYNNDAFNHISSFAGPILPIYCYQVCYQTCIRNCYRYIHYKCYQKMLFSYAIKM